MYPVKSVKVKTAYDEPEINQESPEMGSYAVSRCFVFRELAKLEEEGVLGSSSLTFTNQLPELKGVYALKSIFQPIRWCEVGYFLFYCLGKENKLPLESLKPKVRVCILKETGPDMKTKYSHKLRDYCSGMNIDNYLDEIKKGLRYMPVCLCHAFESLVELGIVEDGKYMQELTEEDVNRLLKFIN